MISEDEVLWYRLCQQEGHLTQSSISDYTCWKLILQECRAKEHMLRTNWKVGSGQWSPAADGLQGHGTNTGLQLRRERGVLSSPPPPPPPHTHCRVQHLPYTCPISLGPRASSCCTGRSLRWALWSCLAWLVRVTGVSLCQPPPPSSFPASGGLTCSSTVHTGTGVRQALGGPCGGAAAAGEVAEC